MDEHRAGRRLPDLGPRGEGWVALQLGLLLAVAISAIRGPAWPDAAQMPLRLVGIVIVVVGAVLALAGSRALGSSLTPLPRPAPEASFRGDGIYRLVRHPIYGGVLLLAFGASMMSSPLALIWAGLLGLLFEGKRVHEESWLLDRYPEYGAYRARVRRRFLPFLW